MPTVMVIQPEVLVRTTIGELLRDGGYRVIEGVCAEDARTVLNTDTALDIVLVDARLTPACNGFELANQLRQIRPGMDVILTSGLADATEKSTRLCRQGAVEKPHRPQEAGRRIHPLFER